MLINIRHDTADCTRRQHLRKIAAVKDHTDLFLGSIGQSFVAQHHNAPFVLGDQAH